MPSHNHACTKEIAALEDLRSINMRKRTYGLKLLLTKTRLPEPAKILIATNFLIAPLHATCAFQNYIDTRIPRWRGLGLDICILHSRSMARELQVMQQLDKRRENLRQETIPEGALEAVDGCFWILEQLDEDNEES